MIQISNDEINTQKAITHDIFGSVKTPFNSADLTDLILNGEHHEAKLYVASRIAKVTNPLSGAVWNGKKVDILKLKDIREGYLSALPKIVTFVTKTETKRGKKIIVKETQNTASVYDWWNTFSGVTYNIGFNLHEKVVYKHDNMYFINTASPFPHTYKIQEEFSDETKSACEIIWQHINKVWASEDKDMFEYLKSWFGHAVSGHKMKSILYGKSGQGVGKSIVPEFIADKVLGDLAMVSSDSLPYLGHFTSAFLGKSLCCLEEAPTSTILEWRKLSSNLKSLATASKLKIEEKCKPPYYVENVMSLLILTNKNAINLEADDRRYVCLDISEDLKDNVNYFNTLAESMNEVDVGACFFSQCVDIYNKNKNFNEMRIPTTETKRNLIVTGLPSAIQFIRDRYLSHGIGTSLTNQQFYDEYCDYQKGKGSVMHKVTFCKTLKGIGIESKVKKLNKIPVRIVEYTFKQLLDIFTKNKWVHESDDFVEASDDNEDYGFLLDGGEKIDEDNQQEVIEPEVIEPEVITPPTPDIITIVDPKQISGFIKTCQDLLDLETKSLNSDIALDNEDNDDCDIDDDTVDQINEFLLEFK